MSYISRLQAAVERTATAACVGLDPRFEQLPPDVIAAASGAPSGMPQIALAFEIFCKRVIDSVASLVPCVKPQAAFFEECGPDGTVALANVIRHAREAGLLVICDAKRGDIGSTAEAYARGYLAGEEASAAPWGADALTVNPYLGRDTLEPFVRVAQDRGAAIYVLVRTSNPGAGTLQDVTMADQTVYQRVAGIVEEMADATRGSDAYGCVGAVVGATYPKELVSLRAAMPHAPLLIPGYGSQGATAKDVAPAFAPDGQGAVINNSRALIFAYQRKDLVDKFAPDEWPMAIAHATGEMISALRSATGQAG